MASTERRYRIRCSCMEDGILYEDVNLADTEKQLARYLPAGHGHDVYIEYADVVMSEWRQLPDGYGSEGEYL